MAAAVCEACGAELRAPTYTRRSPVLRIAVAAALLGILGVAGAAYWNARQRDERKAEIWRLSDEAFAAVKEGRFREALPMLRRYVTARPRDAQMLYLLAVTERETNEDPLAGVTAAQSALDVDPSFSEAALFLAVAHDATGDTERAIEYARRAAAGSRPSPECHTLLAMLELRRARPNVEAAIDALREALTGADDDPRLIVLLALLEIRRAGGGSLDSLPANVLVLVGRAKDVVFGADDELAADPFIRLAEVEFTLAQGRAAPARRLAERLVADEQLGADVAQRARLLLGRAALDDDDDVAARSAFEAALRRAPTRETALAVVIAYRRRGALVVARELLAAAAARDDADERVADVVAGLDAELGDIESAAAGLREARTRRPGDIELLLQLGDVLAAQGDMDGADEAFADAEARADRGNAAPSLRRARLSVARCATAGARRAAAATAIERIDERLGDPRSWDDPAALELRGRLAVAAGRAAEGAQLLRSAVQRAPQEPKLKLALAEAVLAEGAAESLRRAAALVLEAADAAPYEERVVVRAARLLIALGDARQANTVCQRFLDHVGERPAVLGVAADASRRLGRYDDAAARLERARELAGGVDDDGRLLGRLMDSLLRAGRLRDARRLLGDAPSGEVRGRLATLLAMHGATPEERFMVLERQGAGLELAFAQLSRGAPESALGTLREALRSDAGDAQVRRALVLLLLDTVEAPTPERIAEARRVAEGAGDGSSAGLAEVLRGAVDIAEGDFAAARSALAAAVEMVPEDPYANLLYGRALFALGERREALAPLRRAVDLPGALPSFDSVLAQCLFAVAQDTEEPRRRERLLWEVLLHDTLHVGATVDLVNILFDSGRPDDAARLARRLVARSDLQPALARGLRRLTVAAALRTMGLGDVLPYVDEFPFADADAAGRLMDGLLLLRAGRHDEALSLLEGVRERYPAGPIAIMGVIECHARAGRVDVARRVAEVADAAAGATRFRIALAGALLRAGRDRETLEATADLALYAPADESFVAARVRAALRLGDVAGALRTLETAASAASGAAVVRLTLARCSVLRETGAAAEALTIARGLREAAQGDADLAARVRLSEAEALLRLGRHDAAAEIEPGLRGVLGDGDAESARLAARTAFVSGTLAMVQGRPDDAVSWLRTSLRLDPTEPAAANNLAWLLAKRPSRAAEALALARRATETEPENAEFWDTRAACARTAGRPGEAEEAWRTALALTAREGASAARLRQEAAVALAELLAEGARFEEAAGLARGVLERSPRAEIGRRARAVLRLE